MTRSGRKSCETHLQQQHSELIAAAAAAAAAESGRARRLGHAASIRVGLQTEQGNGVTRDSDSTLPIYQLYAKARLIDNIWPAQPTSTYVYTHRYRDREKYWMKFHSTDNDSNIT